MSSKEILDNSIERESPKSESAPRSSHCYDAIEVHTEFGEPRDLHYALDRITDDWVDAGQCCGQTTLDLRDACRSLVAIVDLWDWMIDMRSRIDKDANINRSGIWVFLDVDDEIIARGETPLEAIANAQAAVERGIL